MSLEIHSNIQRVWRARPRPLFFLFLQKAIRALPLQFLFPVQRQGFSSPLPYYQHLHTTAQPQARVSKVPFQNRFSRPIRPRALENFLLKTNPLNLPQLRKKFQSSRLAYLKSFLQPGGGGFSVPRPRLWFPSPKNRPLYGKTAVLASVRILCKSPPNFFSRLSRKKAITGLAFFIAPDQSPGSKANVSAGSFPSGTSIT